jgi:oligopeptide/dipeptide ABC transporter ATP-binding protein
MLRILLEVRNLKKYFPIKTGLFKTTRYLHAVDNVSLIIGENETLGLVGESGCGKSTLARTILRLIEPTSGEVLFNGVNILKLSHNEMKKIRLKMQIVYQDPFSSLNPRMRIKDIVSEPFIAHGVAKGEEAREKALDLLCKVGLGKEHLYRFPHELSGGQKQRVAIARALALDPEFIILDEPTSFLDVSIQAQILNLLLKIQRELKLSYLFISHDLRVIYHMSDRVAVMYAGKIVEIASAEKIFQHPLHPYTQALLSSIPIPDPEIRRKKIILKGEVPSLIDPPPGCRFYSRCPHASPTCRKEEVELLKAEDNHFVACNHIE